MTEEQRDDLIRRYAKGDVGWSDLQRSGFRDYVEVLGALGERGLRPPIARDIGPNLASREAGRTALREALARTHGA